MSSYSPIPTAIVLLTGLGNIAHAQTWRHIENAPYNQHEAVVDGRSAASETPANVSGAVPPSESRTVMGLRVPR